MIIASLLFFFFFFVIEMEKNDGGSSKVMGDVQEQGESSAKWIKCRIEEEAFCCDDCTKPLRPPIFQVNSFDKRTFC